MSPDPATRVTESLAFPRTKGVPSLNGEEIILSGYEPVIHELAKRKRPAEMKTTALIQKTPTGIAWGHHGYLHVFNRGLYFLPVGAAMDATIESLIDWVGIMFPVPTPPNTTSDEPKPQWEALEERWVQQRSSKEPRWTEATVAAGSFRFGFTDLVEVAACETKKTGLLQYVTDPNRYLRATCEDENGNREVFSIDFQQAAGWVPYFMQRRVVTEMSHFVDHIYLRELNWQPVVEAARESFTQKYGDDWRKKHEHDAYEEGHAALARLEEGLDNGAAIREAQQQLARELETYRAAHPMLASMIDSMTRIAASDEAKSLLLRPPVVVAALMRPTEAEIGTEPAKRKASAS